MDIILMGDSKAGRSSIAKVIFQKMVSKQTMLLGQTSKMQTYDFKIQKIQFKLYDFPARYDTNDPPPSQQMILNHASALIFVLNPQSDTLKALDDFINIYQYLKKNNKGNCPIFIFVNKADIDMTQQDTRNQYQIKLKKKLTEDGVDLKELDFFFTSIFDYSIFEAFSKVIQKIIPCSQSISKILNNLSNYCKIQKVYLFDLITKLYIGHNDQRNLDSTRYQICSQMLDIFIDISFLYGNQKNQDESENSSVVKMEMQDQNELFILRCVEKYLALVIIIKESNYDRPYLVNKNVQVFKKSLAQLLNATISTLK